MTVRGNSQEASLLSWGSTSMTFLRRTEVGGEKLRLGLESIDARGRGRRSEYTCPVASGSHLVGRLMVSPHATANSEQENGA